MALVAEPSSSEQKDDEKSNESPISDHETGGKSLVDIPQIDRNVSEETKLAPEGKGDRGQVDQSKGDVGSEKGETDKPGTQSEPAVGTLKPQQEASTWILVLNDPNFNNHPYYTSTNGIPSQTDEPSEPYYVYDTMTGQYEPSLRQPSGSNTKSADANAATDAVEEYQGYNPKIHGKYDPNASYNDYHKRKRETEEASVAAKRPQTMEQQYAAMGAFNRHTGQFQTGEQSAERHDDYHKSGRQMAAFFDVDAAANAHGGRSLKEERRNQKLSAKQLREMKEKQKQKKDDKKRKWLMS